MSSVEAKEPLLPQSLTSKDEIDLVPSDATMPRYSNKSRFQIAACVILISLFWLARTWNCDHEHSERDTKVPLDVHIMSKCPDARDCLKKLVLPTMANVSDKVDFRLSFIGRYAHSLCITLCPYTHDAI